MSNNIICLGLSIQTALFTLPYSDTEGSQNESPGIRDMERAVQEK